MRGSRKFCQRGSTPENVLLVDEGRKDPNITKSGLSLARQQNAIDAFHRRADDGPTLNADLIDL